MTLEGQLGRLFKEVQNNYDSGRKAIEPLVEGL